MYGRFDVYVCLKFIVVFYSKNKWNYGKWSTELLKTFLWERPKTSQWVLPLCRLFGSSTPSWVSLSHTGFLNVCVGLLGFLMCYIYEITIVSPKKNSFNFLYLEVKV